MILEDAFEKTNETISSIMSGLSKEV